MAKKTQQIEQRKGVIYARYSSHMQKEESIEQQVEECMSFAQSNNIEVVRVYSDKALSGRSDKRPQFQKMMRDAETDSFDVVIAYKSSRIARNMLTALDYENKLSRLGIDTFYAKEEFGNTAAGRFALRTMMNVNQFYSENLAEDVKRGMRDNAENCKANGPLPYGFTTDKEGYIIPEPLEAEIVREVFRRTLDGETRAQIVDDLNRRGIKTKQGNEFRRTSLQAMLKNPMYIGTYSHSGVVVEHGITSIITQEDWAAMEERRSKRSHAASRRHEATEYLLTGKLRCAYCDSLMVGMSGISKSGAKHCYYACNNHRRGDCKKKNIRKDVLERLVAQLTHEYILRPDVIEWIAENAVKVLNESGNSVDVSLMREELSDNQRALKNLMSAIEQGIITPTTKARLLELESEIADIEQAIKTAQALKDEFTSEKTRIVYSLERLKGGDPSNPSYQKLLIDTFVKTVWLSDDDIRIDYFYTDEQRKRSYALKDYGISDPECVRASAKVEYHIIPTRTPAEGVIIALFPHAIRLQCKLSVTVGR